MSFSLFFLFSSFFFLIIFNLFKSFDFHHQILSFFFNWFLIDDIFFFHPTVNLGLLHIRRTWPFYSYLRPHRSVHSKFPLLCWEVTIFPPIFQAGLPLRELLIFILLPSGAFIVSWPLRQPFVILIVPPRSSFGGVVLLW